MRAADFFDWPASLAVFAPHFRPEVPPWEWLPQIRIALEALTTPMGRPPVPSGVHLEGAVWIHASVRLPASATIVGPVWLGPGTEVRPGALIRGPVIAGEGCVLGHACEFKNCLLLDGAQVPHFNYVGDSILGNRAHLGAGVICSNLRLDQQPVMVRSADGTVHATGLRKFGAVLGDAAEVGCNAVLNPGAILGRRALVTPALAFGGELPANTIAHARPAVRFVPRRD